MKIILAGGSGQIGTILARQFPANGHEVVVLSRGGSHAPAQCRTMAWDGESNGTWTHEFDNADVIINLAGRSVNCRYNAANRQLIMDSRLRSTQAVGDAIRNAVPRSRVWLQMSTATIYAHRFDSPNDEGTGILGTVNDTVPETWRFSHDVALSWERAANAIETPRTRKVLLRSAIVMSPDAGGPFDILMGLVRRGLGGRNGSGKQYVSWIHERDFVRAIDWIIEHPGLNGPVNLAAPKPLPNEDFMAALRTAAGARIGLPATNWMLEIGARFLNTETELILKSRRVVPGRLLDSGFTFQLPNWPTAAIDLYQRWAAAQKK